MDIDAGFDTDSGVGEAAAGEPTAEPTGESGGEPVVPPDAAAPQFSQKASPDRSAAPHAPHAASPPEDAGAAATPPADESALVSRPFTAVASLLVSPTASVTAS